MSVLERTTDLSQTSRHVQTAQRRDPRPRLMAPYATEPWLPVMSTLNEVIGTVSALKPPGRDEHGEIVTKRHWVTEEQ